MFFFPFACFVVEELCRSGFGQNYFLTTSTPPYYFLSLPTVLSLIQVTVTYWWPWEKFSGEHRVKLWAATKLTRLTESASSNIIFLYIPHKWKVLFARADWLAQRWLAKYKYYIISSTIHPREAEEKQNGFCRYVVTNKVIILAASYPACVVYTKTIIYLSVGE